MAKGFTFWANWGTHIFGLEYFRRKKYIVYLVTNMVKGWVWERGM